MESPAEELLRLAQADIGISVALEQPGSATDIWELRDRQRTIQQRILHLQRQIARLNPNDTAHEELKALRARVRGQARA